MRPYFAVLDLVGQVRRELVDPIRRAGDRNQTRQEKCRIGVLDNRPQLVARARRCHSHALLPYLDEIPVTPFCDLIKVLSPNCQSAFASKGMLVAIAAARSAFRAAVLRWAHHPQAAGRATFQTHS